MTGCVKSCDECESMLRIPEVDESDDFHDEVFCSHYGITVKRNGSCNTCETMSELQSD